MLCLMLVGSDLLAANPAEALSLSKAETSAYQEARAHAGRDPEAQLKLALWCEALGLTAERMIHLARAVLADPSHAAARLDGHGRLTRTVGEARGRCRPSPGDAKLTAALAEYSRRILPTAGETWPSGVKTMIKARGHRAHLAVVTRLGPKRDAAWKRLGYKKHDGRWMTDAQVAAEKTDRKVRADADAHWRPLLEQ